MKYRALCGSRSGQVLSVNVMSDLQKYLYVYMNLEIY